MALIWCMRDQNRGTWQISCLTYKCYCGSYKYTFSCIVLLAFTTLNINQLDRIVWIQSRWFCVFPKAYYFSFALINHTNSCWTITLFGFRMASHMTTNIYQNISFSTDTLSIHRNPVGGIFHAHKLRKIIAYSRRADNTTLSPCATARWTSISCFPVEVVKAVALTVKNRSCAYLSCVVTYKHDNGCSIEPISTCRSMLIG